MYIEYNNGRTHPLNISNAYAPTLNSSITEIEHFYNTIESIINKVNKKEVILCGDFNTQIGKYHEDHPDIIGLYSKEIR